MPSETLPNKREVMLALLAEASVFIHLDPRGPSVRVPPWFKNQAQLVLQVGLNMAVPIPDLDVSEEGIKCTLSFSRRPFFCSIPWKSVFGLVGEGGPGLVWPDDVPIEVAAQVHAQGQKQAGQKPAAKKPDPRDSGRARLRAVGSEPPPADSPEEQVPAAAAAPIEPATPPAPVPVAAPKQKIGAVPALAREAAPSPELAVDTTTSSGDSSSEQDGEDKSNRPAPSTKATGKRELPPYLRVVK